MSDDQEPFAPPVSTDDAPATSERMKLVKKETPVSNALQRLVSEYDGKSPTLDVMIERYKEMYADAQFLRLQWKDAPAYWLPNRIMAMHPLLKAWLELQRNMQSALKEIGFTARLHDLAGQEADPIDTFLENLARTNRPHRSVNRGGG